MSSLALTLALAALPAGIPAGSRPVELEARCLWAERGWRAAVLGLELHRDPRAVERAHENLLEHRRLHGWQALASSGSHSAWITRAAPCPPAGLGEISRHELEPPHHGVYDLYRDLALVLARNGLTEQALRFLDAARPGPVAPGDENDVRRLYEAWSMRDQAHVLAAAGDHERALSVLDEFEPARGCGLEVEAQLDALALLRARCLVELSRTDELEELCFEHLAADGLEPTSCAWVEVLMEGWRRSQRQLGREDLQRELLARPGEHDHAGGPGAIDRLWDTAERHRAALVRGSWYGTAHLVDLLDQGDHELEVRVRLAEAGPEGLDDLIALAEELPTDDPRHDGLFRVLVSTGDPRLRPLLEARFPDREDFVAGLRYEAWERAKALREDLAGN